MHQKNLAKWTRTLPIPNKDSIISSHARGNNEKGFTPSYESEGRPNMYYLINFEYGRIWFKERGKYEKEIYTKKEMMKEESKIKRRYVQRTMVPKKKEKTLPIIKLKRMTTSHIIREFIAKDTVVMFYKSSCSFCKQAKAILDGMKVSYTTVELENRKDGEEIQLTLKKMTGERTVPRIFINGECIGGASDLQALYDSGELQKILK